jgi:hypothetical protein
MADRLVGYITLTNTRKEVLLLHFISWVSHVSSVSFADQIFSLLTRSQHPHCRCAKLGLGSSQPWAILGLAEQMSNRLCHPHVQGVPEHQRARDISLPLASWRGSDNVCDKLAIGWARNQLIPDFFCALHRLHSHWKITTFGSLGCHLSRGMPALSYLSMAL